MDNRRMDITSEGEKHLALAMELIWLNAPGGKATHYKAVRLERTTRYYASKSREGMVDNCELDGVDFLVSHHSEEKVIAGEPNTLILLWHDEQGATALPYPLSLRRATEFVSGWLSEFDYGREPDHDGSNGKGWRLFTESWGHVAGHHYAIVGIQAAWAMYGK